MTWARFFDHYEPVHALVAESGGELLGLTHYLFHRSTTAIEPTCYLQDLFTNAAARGKGVGRALDQRRVRTGETCRIVPRLLADPRDQCHRDAALRQGGGPARLCHLPQAVLTGFANAVSPLRRLVDKSGCHRHVTKHGYAAPASDQAPRLRSHAPSGPRQSPRLTGAAFFFVCRAAMRPTVPPHLAASARARHNVASLPAFPRLSNFGHRSCKFAISAAPACAFPPSASAATISASAPTWRPRAR